MGYGVIIIIIIDVVKEYVFFVGGPKRIYWGWNHEDVYRIEFFFFGSQN